MIKKPIVGISVGDPGGIGPEITAKALAQPEIHDICRPVVIADADIMRDAVRIAGTSLKVKPVEVPFECDFHRDILNILDMENMDMEALHYKKVTAAQGKACFEYIEKVIELANAGIIDATVTGPIHKEALFKAGYKYPGHTEIFAELTGTKDYAMMLADGDFRVIHVSTHVSLLEAISRVKKDRIHKVIQLGDDALRRIGIENPRIAVAGLNPHAGENGLFGWEDTEEIVPAISAAVSEGINALGPIPPDTVFSKMRGRQYDIVVVMYHDQGHIPTKLIGFQYNDTTKQWESMAGVNVTLGLPIIRASVDHGVAFGKAGEGRANPQSMIEAIKMAVRLCGDGGGQDR